MISHLAKSVRESLRDAFPNSIIKEEEYVFYKGQRLFFDFYLPDLKIYLEVQGVQHEKFNKHFHNDAAAFRASKRRDALKREWCELNDATLVYVNYDEIPISSKMLLTKIQKTQEV